jgi:hypothetical protein
MGLYDREVSENWFALTEGISVLFPHYHLNPVKTLSSSTTKLPADKN